MDLKKDLEAVKRIPIVPSMLNVICQTTGMGFAAIARVTNDRWLACSVHDEVQFGLQEGEELKIETTLCNEVKGCRKPIVVDDFDEDPEYKNHHTPNIYSLKSYISVPIILKDGTFFGTLCAIDAKPAKVKNPKVIGTFSMFAELLAFHLQSQDLLDRSVHQNQELKSKNTQLTKVNHDLDTFVYTASHDLRSPVNNVEGLLDTLSNTLKKDPIDRKKVNQITSLMKTSLLRLGMTIKDLTTIVEADRNSNLENDELIDIFELTESVQQDLDQQIAESNAKIEVISEDKVNLFFSRRNFKSIIYNLLSNAIKYRSPDRDPEVTIKLFKAEEKTQLVVEDNGLGIPADKQDQIFTIFKRLHKHVEGSGIGLYLVKRMVENGNGQITVESTLNKGTTFTLSF